MQPTVLQTYSCFVFDVDRTIAENGSSIQPEIIKQVAKLIHHVSIAIITSRTLEEGLLDFSKAVCEILISSGSNAFKNLTIFPTHAAKAYRINLKTSEAIQLYNRAAEDEQYKEYYKYYFEGLEKLGITAVNNISYDEKEVERLVKIHDRASQITMFFSHKKLRTEYETVLNVAGVAYTRHASNVLHIMPADTDKHIAINYLDRFNPSTYLVFADGFYQDHETGRYGNDLSFADLPRDQVRCVNVGEEKPGDNTGVYHCESADHYEWRLAHQLLQEILDGKRFDELGLKPY